MNARPYDKIESEVEHIEQPSTDEFRADEWKKQMEPHQSFGKVIDSMVRYYFEDEITELRGDADEIMFDSVEYVADDGVWIEYTKIWR